MPRVILIVFLILNGFCGLHAQTNFVSGYYVSPSNDTIRGLIDYRSSLRNRLVCFFKPDAKSSRIKLYPNRIKSFVLEDNIIYESWPLPGESIDDGQRGFFRVEVKGDLSLLTYGKKQFARRKNDNTLTEISTNEVRTSTGNSVKSYQGLGMLKVMMEDCPSITYEELEKLYKSNASLTPAFIQYNVCRNASYATPGPIRIKPAFNIGIQATYLSMDVSLSKNLRDLALLHSGMSYGVFVSVFVPRLSERLRLVTEATFFNADMHERGISNGSEQELSLSFSTVRMPLLVRYERGWAFVEAGLQNHLVFSQRSYWRQTTQMGGDVIITEVKEFGQLTGWAPGFIAGVGLKQEIRGQSLRGGVRYSTVTDTKHFHEPSFATLEFILSLQLGTKKDSRR